MAEEIESFQRNGTWRLINLLLEKKVIGVKWLYKTKYKADGQLLNIRQGWLLKDLFRIMVLIIRKWFL